MRIARFLALSFGSVLSLASLNAQNLIANPGFESGLTSWMVTSGHYLNTAIYSPDSTIRHSGNFSVRGDESNDESLGALQQNLTGTLVAGRTYVLSGWIKTQNVADGGGAIIGLAYVDQYGAAPADGGVLAIGFEQGTQDWTFYRSAPFTLKPMPSDTVALVVSLDFSAAHGTAWWDDLKLIQSCTAGDDRDALINGTAQGSGCCTQPTGLGIVIPTHAITNIPNEIGWTFAIQVLPSTCNLSGQTLQEVVTWNAHASTIPCYPNATGTNTKEGLIHSQPNGSAFFNYYSDALGLPTGKTFTATCEMDFLQTINWKDTSTTPPTYIPLLPMHKIVKKIFVSGGVITSQECLGNTTSSLQCGQVQPYQ